MSTQPSTHSSMSRPTHRTPQYSRAAHIFLHRPLTLTNDTDFECPASYGHDPCTTSSWFKRYLETGRRTDGQTDTTDRFTSPAGAVGEILSDV